MKDDNQTIVREIDSLIRQHLWFDFQVYRYEGNSLSIVGSTDLTYYHSLEIIFKEVFFVSCFFQGWHSDTSKTVIEIPTAELEQKLNLKYEIESGYQVFIIHPEDYENQICIVAKRIAYRTDTVTYYSKENIKEKE
jgi:hypothetical protein